MKLDLYLDIPPAGDFDPNHWYYSAQSAPVSAKPDGWTRLKITVNIPDVYVNIPHDGCAPVDNVREVDKDTYLERARR